MEEKYIVALEIGSSKIKGAIGTVDSAGALSVKAVEEEKLADVVRYGCIRNVVETANAIRTVIGRLEQREPGRTVTGVYVSVGGRSMMAQSIEIERRLPSEMEITNDLISDIINDALAYQLSERSVSTSPSTTSLSARWPKPTSCSSPKSAVRAACSSISERRPPPCQSTRTT